VKFAGMVKSQVAFLQKFGPVGEIDRFIPAAFGWSVQLSAKERVALAEAYLSWSCIVAGLAREQWDEQGVPVPFEPMSSAPSQAILRGLALMEGAPSVLADIVEASGLPESLVDGGIRKGGVVEPRVALSDRQRCFACGSSIAKGERVGQVKLHAWLWPFVKASAKKGVYHRLDVCAGCAPAVNPVDPAEVARKQMDELAGLSGGLLGVDQLS